MSYNLISLFLGVSLVVLAVLSLEFKRIMYSIMTLCGFSIVLAVVFFYLSAPLVGVFQLAVLAGAVTVLFLIALMLTGKVEVD
ncbi:MAG: hydrogenase subunit MbhD domain-containing protein [Candidatus Methanomethylicia archaeon]